MYIYDINNDDREIIYKILIIFRWKSALFFVLIISRILSHIYVQLFIVSASFVSYRIPILRRNIITSIQERILYMLIPNTTPTMNEIFKDYPDVVSIEQLQKMLNIGRNSAYELVRNDAIKTVKVGTRYIIPKANVIAYLFA